MTKRTENLIAIILFCACIAAVPLYWLFAPERTFSDSERRYLAERPVLTLQDADAWSFGDDVEAYLADQLPLRDVFVGVNAYVTLFTGRQVSEDVFADDEGYLVERPVTATADGIAKRMANLAALGKATGLQVHLLVPPSTGYVRRAHLPASLSALYQDGALIAQLRGCEGVTLIETEAAFVKDGERYFYRTDHHWNADGAFAAYRLLMEQTGRTPLKPEDFYIHTVNGYVGSTRSRSALWLTRGETMQIYEPKTPVRVTFSNAEGEYGSLFFYAHLEEYDWYPLFLDGNHPLTVVENLSADADGVLVIVKDSFANTLAPLLTPSYKTVVMVDPRFYRLPVSDVCKTYGATELLFVYSLERITNDTNLLVLK